MFVRRLDSTYFEEEGKKIRESCLFGKEFSPDKFHDLDEIKEIDTILVS